MDWKLGKFKLFPPLDKLEIYLLAADNPIGRKQLRPIFRRKRNRQVLTREQVTAIKRGRRVLRQEMKERGLKRRIDFEETASGLGLYFDRNRLLWPFFLWLLRDNTAVKILATTAVLTTVVTVTQTVIEYVTEYVTQYVTQYVTEYVTEYLDKDRFTIALSDEMEKTGFELSETPDFEKTSTALFAIPIWEVPCVSISQIPSNVDDLENFTDQQYFYYTFYCRYINKEAEKDTGGDLSKYAVNYDWGLRIHAEGLDASQYNGTADPTDPTAPTTETETDELRVSDAVWVMVIQDGEVILKARGSVDQDGTFTPAMLPTQEVLESERPMAFIDRSVEYIDSSLRAIDPRITIDNVYKLDEVFTDPSELAKYQEPVDKFLGSLTDLMRLILRTSNWRNHVNVVKAKQNDSYSYYQIKAEDFVSDKIVAEGKRTNILPWVEGQQNYQKYTVVFWLEGDDPECTNDLMNGYIGMNFQIKAEGEGYVDTIVTPTVPTEAVG